MKNKYVGVNDGCHIGSSVTIEDPELEARLAKLEKDSNIANVKLNVMLGNLYTKNRINLPVFRTVDADQWVIDNFVRDAWKGHLAKIDGIWMISGAYARVLHQFVFGTKMVFTKPVSNNFDIAIIITNKSNNTYLSYSEMVDLIVEVKGKCSKSHAKKTLKDLIDDGYIVKHPHHTKYKSAVIIKDLQSTPVVEVKKVLDDYKIKYNDFMAKYNKKVNTFFDATKWGKEGIERVVNDGMIIYNEEYNLYEILKLKYDN